MKNLILITSEYPYLSGEPFLQNEVPYLSKAFNEVFVFSINAKSEYKITRELPENVRCFPLENTTSKLKYLKYTINGIKVINKDLAINSRSAGKILSAMYTRGRAYSIAQAIYDLISVNRLNVENVTIYSFWFAYQAVAAWLLSEILTRDGNITTSVARAHGYDLYWERATGSYLPYQDSSLKNLNMCFPCSDYGKHYLLNKYPWAKDKLITQRLGTKDCGVNFYKGEKTLVTCCNLESLKRMTLFADAFCKVAKNDRDLKWICIGDGEEKAKIRRIVEQANLCEQVIMTGKLTNKAVMQLYAEVGIMYFCNISTTEGLPVSIMEAMSFGIPIIATAVGGTAELVDQKNGILLDADLDANKLAKILFDMINMEKNRYCEYRLSSRKKWEELVSADKNYKEFCNIIA